VSEELAGGLPNGELPVSAVTSASLFFEDPDAVVDDIVAFVTGRRPARPTRVTGAPAELVVPLSPRSARSRPIAAGDSNAEIAGRSTAQHRRAPRREPYRRSTRGTGRCDCLRHPQRLA
jgi:hypothetical protein